MNSPVLSAAARLVAPVIFIVSLVLLYQGHNLPGGGFIGGLIAATAILLRDFARWQSDGAEGSGGPFPERDDKMPMPILLMVAGLAVAGGSALLPVLFGDPYFTGYWLPTFSLPLLGTVHLGTPLVFDIGVYLTVIGFVVHSARCLKEDPDDTDNGREGAWN